ncbi:hypothetical protein ACQP0C_21855 [Nocardia sp. CA-129566]|uniref:hypothetical protein n=1 Tax=Nocardia sp. CA-129566 TaxID=3239976 RepID=UPI003D98C9FC
MLEPDGGFEVLLGVIGQCHIDVCQELRRVVDGARAIDGRHGCGSASSSRQRHVRTDSSRRLLS